MEELRLFQHMQLEYQDERDFTTALALMDDQGMQAREEGTLALEDGRADEPPAFPDADPDYDYNPSSLIPTYQARPGAQSKAFPSAPGTMSKASMAPPPKAQAKATYAAQRSRPGNLSRSQQEQLRWQQQGMMWRRHQDDQV